MKFKQNWSTNDMFPPETPSTQFETHQEFSVFYRDEATVNLKAKGFYVERFGADPGSYFYSFIRLATPGKITDIGGAF